MAYPAPSAPLAGTSRLHRRAAYTRCLRCAGAPRRPASGSGLSLPFRPDMPSSLTPGSSSSHVSSCAMPTRPSPRSERLGTPNTPAIRFTRGTSFEASLVRICYGLSGCSPPWTDLTEFPQPPGAFTSRLPTGWSPVPPLDMTTTATGLLCWRDFHPQEWQLASLHQILTWFVQRWQVEVTFRDVRDHLRVQTQRQWSDKAIARTTPCLLGLFSLVTLLAARLSLQARLAVATAAWYRKKSPTFADTLAAVRREIWREQGFLTSQIAPEVKKLRPALLDGITYALCHAA